MEAKKKHSGCAHVDSFQFCHVFSLTASQLFAPIRSGKNRPSIWSNWDPKNVARMGNTAPYRSGFVWMFLFLSGRIGCLYSSTPQSHGVNMLLVFLCCLFVMRTFVHIHFFWCTPATTTQKCPLWRPGGPIICQQQKHPGLTCFITGGGGGEMFFICFWSVVVEGEVGRLDWRWAPGSCTADRGWHVTAHLGTWCGWQMAVSANSAGMVCDHLATSTSAATTTNLEVGDGAIGAWAVAKMLKRNVQIWRGS